MIGDGFKIMRKDQKRRLKYQEQQRIEGKSVGQAITCDRRGKPYPNTILFDEAKGLASKRVGR